jgi:hypothetical protein
MSVAADAIRLNVTITAAQASPRELRMRLVIATREAIQRAALNGRIRLEHAEELWRAVSDPERA